MFFLSVLLAFLFSSLGLFFWFLGEFFFRGKGRRERVMDTVSVVLVWGVGGVYFFIFL